MPLALRKALLRLAFCSYQVCMSLYLVHKIRILFCCLFGFLQFSLLIRHQQQLQILLLMIENTHTYRKRAFTDTYNPKTASLKYQVHRDFPLCNPETGAPQLEWGQCYHLGCGRTFSSGGGLADHLKQQGSYTAGFSKSHAQIYQGKFQLLTDQCLVCNVKFEDQSGLVKHLARLGIEGYWKKGQTYEKQILQVRAKGKSQKQILYGKTTQVPYITNSKVIQDLYETQLCLVCEQFPSKVLYETCKHFNVCYRCYKSLQVKNVCIYCKTKSKALFQISLPTISEEKV